MQDGPRSFDCIGCIDFFLDYIKQPIKVPRFKGIWFTFKKKFLKVPDQKCIQKLKTEQLRNHSSDRAYLQIVLQNIKKLFYMGV